MDISVIVINYRTHDLTSACIESVIQHTEGLSYEIILVENGTAQFSEADAGRWDGAVQVVVSDTNLGFAGGNNLGIRSATGKYILLLNSDTYLTGNALLTAFRYMESHPEAGVMSVRLVYPDGRHQSVAQRFPSVKYSLIELLRLQKFVGRKAAGKMLLGAFFDHRETVRADWVWGAFFMFPAAVLQKMPDHKLDDTYFMYAEDKQWCMDIGKAGYEVHFCADTEVVHISGGSSANRSQLIEENEQRFLEKNFSPFTGACIRWLQRRLA